MDFFEKFQAMEAIGHHASLCLDRIGDQIDPGISTQFIDDMVRDYAADHGLRCAPLNYRGFPAHCCTSTNHIVCHGIPSPTKILKDGDIIKVDVTFICPQGWHGDSCRTFFVGKGSIKAIRLVDVTIRALNLGIEAAQPGNPIGAIGRAIQSFVEGKERMKLVRGYVGHGIGQAFHTPPVIAHYETTHSDSSIVMKPGMIFTIEPMVNFGNAATKQLSDGWTVVTKDRSLSAQFEHTIGITENGNVIFTAGKARGAVAV